MKRFFKFSFGGLVLFLLESAALSEPLYLVVIVPMILIGWLGWFIGKKVDIKNSLHRRFSVGFGLLGLLFGCIAGSLLSFAFLPCGIFGC